MKLFLALLFLALPALADTSSCVGTLTGGVGTISCTAGAATCTPPQPTPVVKPCPPGQTGTITTSFSCVGSTWTPTTASSCAPTPPPAGVTIIPAPPVGGTGGNFTAQPNTIYAFAVPIPYGSVAISKGGGSPDFSMKVALSAIAGDYPTAQTMPLTVTKGFGIPPNRTVYPYYAYQGSESAGLSWTNADAGYGVPVVSAGWYFSFESTATVPVYFSLQIPQQ